MNRPKRQTPLEIASFAVDGESVDPAATVRHAQRDPSPGGLRFQVVASTHEIARWQRRSLEATAAEVRLGDPYHLMLALEFAVDWPETRAPAYVLNTVD